MGAEVHNRIFHTMMTYDGLKYSDFTLQLKISEQLNMNQYGSVNWEELQIKKIQEKDGTQTQNS